MLAYTRIIIREALRHGGTRWMEYNCIFRRQVAINPATPWNSLQPSLQAATILGRGIATGVCCTTCLECDHTTRQCALAPLQQQLRSDGGSATTISEVNRPPKRPESWLRICVNWNQGTCSRPTCSYRHVCAKWQKNHCACDCPDLPASSEYKSAAASQPSRPPTSKSWVITLAEIPHCYSSCQIWHSILTNQVIRIILILMAPYYLWFSNRLPVMYICMGPNNLLSGL